VREAPSGCILTDVRMPGIDGIAFLRHLKERGIALPVIVMTGHADVPLAVEAMKEGAIDFIEKPFDDDLLLAAIRTALKRQEQSAERDAQWNEVRARLETLSERERQVLEGLVAGKANKVIAYDLTISPRTVEIYRANVMAKMQAGSLSELVRMALLAGGKAS
jgi:two-component system response regulator FixJ